jgi:hypothetical protein
MDAKFFLIRNFDIWFLETEIVLLLCCDVRKHIGVMGAWFFLEVDTTQYVSKKIRQKIPSDERS